MKIDSISSSNGGDDSDVTASSNDLQAKWAPGKASLGCLLKTTWKRLGKGRKLGGTAFQVLRPTIVALSFSVIHKIGSLNVK